MGSISSLEQDEDLVKPLAREVVKKKMKELGYDEKMSLQDFTKFASILSDKEQLLKYYLHTDFDQVKSLQQQINKAVTSKNRKKGISSSEPTIDIVDIQEPSLIENEEESVFSLEERQEEEDEDAMGNQEDIELDNLSNPFDKLKKQIRIKLIVAETSKNRFEKNLKRVISPAVNLLHSNPPEFGLFHIALGVGPWKIEFNNSSLAIPRTITGRYAVVCSDIGSIGSRDRLDEIRNTLAEVIVKWNTTMFYSQSGGNLDKNKGNCQEFIDEILKKLGIESMNFPEELKSYVKKLRVKGMATMTFEMSEKFRETFNMGANNKEIEFQSHQQLDLFVMGLLKKDPEFQINYKSTWSFLKSFDRAFWMRHLKQPVKFYKPLMDENNNSELCPFGNPQQYSLIPLRIRKSDD